MIGGRRWGGQPRSTHLVCVEEERIGGKNSASKDLSPISVQTADKGHDTHTHPHTHHQQTVVNKQETLATK